MDFHDLFEVFHGVNAARRDYLLAFPFAVRMLKVLPGPEMGRFFFTH